MDYSKVNNTYFAKLKDDPKDRIQVEIGDTKDATIFHPQVKIMRWDNEVNFSIRAEENKNAIVSLEDNKIKYKTSDYEVHQYEKPEAGEYGGFEFEWILNKKPKTNVITATIEYKDLVFFYQPPISNFGGTPHLRPENVQGSYAVYHKYKSNNYTDKEYKTGKVFHIYRPEVTDSNGKKTWAELHIDKNSKLLTITIPQKYLDECVYPITVDPTFGYTSIAASPETIDNYCWYMESLTTPASNGSLTSLTIYANNTAGSPVFNPALYTDSYPSSRLAYLNSGGTAPTGSYAWITTDLSYAGIVASTQYLLGAYVGGYGNRLGIYNDEVESPELFVEEQTSWQDPADPIEVGPYRISIYATYTAASGTNMKVNISDVWKDVSEVKINIGDTWKTVNSVKINIGDTWKTIF